MASDDDVTPTPVTKPSMLIGGIGRRARWYPDEALSRMVGGWQAAVAADDRDWSILNPADAAAYVDGLRAELAALTKFVAMIEAIADGREPVTCPACSSRFYPSRSDARFCGPTCRMRAHRQTRGRAVDGER